MNYALIFFRIIIFENGIHVIQFQQIILFAVNSHETDKK